MDEMTLIRKFADDAPLPDAGRLADVRAKLMTEIAPRRRRKLRPVGVTGIGVTVAAAAAIVAVTLPSGAPPPAQPQVTPVATVLHNAADVARKRPAVTPKPGQFVYRKMNNGERVIEQWRSVDGKHDGLSMNTPSAPEFPARETIAGCKNGKSEGVNSAGEHKTFPCEPEPGYLDGHVATKSQAFVFVAGTYSVRIEYDDFIKAALGMIMEHELSPTLRADIFDALATVDDLPDQRVTVDPNARDTMGRPAIALTWTDESAGRSPYGTTVLFDPSTYEYLGMPGVPVTTKIVDHAGQR
jgi:hypothetical protein